MTESGKAGRRVRRAVLGVAGCAAAAWVAWRVIARLREAGDMEGGRE